MLLLGASDVAGDAAALAGSEYLELMHGLVAGEPAIDLDLEVAVQRACRRLVGAGVVRSAHDCSDGGLAVALAECSVIGGVGFRGSFSLEGRWDAALFGETQSRIVVTVPSDELGLVEEVAREDGVPWTVLGVTGGEALRMAGLIDLPLKDLASTWRNALERSMR